MTGPASRLISSRTIGSLFFTATVWQRDAITLTQILLPDNEQPKRDITPLPLSALRSAGGEGFLLKAICTEWVCAGAQISCKYRHNKIIWTAPNDSAEENAMAAFTRNVTTNGSWPLQGEVYCCLFGRYIAFAVEDRATIDYVEQCAAYMNSLDGQIIEEFCEACLSCRADHLELLGRPAEPLLAARDVLSLLTPLTLLVPNPANGSEPVLHLELNCIWDADSGLEWIARGGRNLYVGSFNARSAWADYSRPQSCNYAWAAA